MCSNLLSYHTGYSCHKCVFMLYTTRLLPLNCWNIPLMMMNTKPPPPILTSLMCSSLCPLTPSFHLTPLSTSIRTPASETKNLKHIFHKAARKISHVRVVTHMHAHDDQSSVMLAHHWLTCGLHLWTKPTAGFSPSLFRLKTVPWAKDTLRVWAFSPPDKIYSYQPYSTRWLYSCWWQVTETKQKNNLTSSGQQKKARSLSHLID